MSNNKQIIKPCNVIIETVDDWTTATIICNGKVHNKTFVSKYYNSTWKEKLPDLCPIYLKSGKKSGVIKRHIFYSTKKSLCGKSTIERTSMARHIRGECGACVDARHYV